MLTLGNDLAFILGDAGEDFSYEDPAGDVLTTSGLYAEDDVPMNTADGDVVALQRTAVIAASAFPGITSVVEPIITRVGTGVRYVVRDHRNAYKGAALRLYLVPA